MSHKIVKTVRFPPSDPTAPDPWKNMVFIKHYMCGHCLKEFESSVKVLAHALAEHLPI